MRLSPSATVGKEGLGDVRLAPDGAEQFGQRGEVGAVAADLEHAFAGVAVERLDDDLAMLGMEFARRSPSDRVIMVGGMNCAKSSTNRLFGRIADRPRDR